jgi:5-methyltetrahydropteroyltriglutamate--homocysteine methyltransferase
MRQSTDRIITTHVGSLARPPAILDVLHAQVRGEPVDEAAFASTVKQAVADSVRRQAEAGIDVVSDGEQGRPSFIGYVNQRLSGFEPRPQPATVQWAGTRERLAFPEYYDTQGSSPPIVMPGAAMACVAPITYRGADALQRDIANLKAALQGVRVEEAFMPAISPTNIVTGRRNEYYRSEDEFLEAIADAMHQEYAAIVDAGLVVQIDDPALSTYYNNVPDSSLEDCRRWADRRVEVVNRAIGDLPRDRVRFHTCYSIDVGPRVHDMPLIDLVDILLKVRAGAFSFEASNPRHEHEYHVWEKVKPPEGMVLIPGVISHTTNLVEHPELIAERIVRYARLVGRENVIAGADCGFAATARDVQDIHPSVVWAKFEALGEGARLATKELW